MIGPLWKALYNTPVHPRPQYLQKSCSWTRRNCYTYWPIRSVSLSWSTPHQRWAASHSVSWNLTAAEELGVV